MIGNVALLSVVLIERFLIVVKCRIRGVVNIVMPSGVLEGDICILSSNTFWCTYPCGNHHLPSPLPKVTVLGIEGLSNRL